MSVKRVIFFGVLLLSLVGAIIFLTTGVRRPESEPQIGPAREMQVGDKIKIEQMKLISSAFENNQSIPVEFTCDGANVNPPLSISGVPEGSKSLVLIVDDPDAPAGDWVHWTLWNIEPDTTEIKQGSLPEGTTEGITDFGKPGYGGPCPPSGTHRYQFKLYALDTILSLGKNASKSDIESAMQGHILDQALLIGLYKRQ